MNLNNFLIGFICGMLLIWAGAKVYFNDYIPIPQDRSKVTVIPVKGCMAVFVPHGQKIYFNQPDNSLSETGQ